MMEMQGKPKHRLVFIVKKEEKMANEDEESLIKTGMLDGRGRRRERNQGKRNRKQEDGRKRRKREDEEEECLRKAGFTLNV
jgi:hypothetical protein